MSRLGDSDKKSLDSEAAHSSDSAESDTPIDEDKQEDLEVDGTHVFGNGVYEGEIDEMGLPHGHGVFTFNNM